MTLDEILERRYSVRSYDSRPVKHEDILAICEAARAAPSASNTQTWRFIAVQNRKTISRLVEEGMGPVVKNKWMRDAPLVIVGCAKPDILVNKIGTSVTGIDYYQVDFGIAMEHMVLKATELGLGTCWVGWINEERVRAILNIPDKVRVLAFLPVGYVKDPVRPPRKRKPLERILFWETWANPQPATATADSSPDGFICPA